VQLTPDDVVKYMCFATYNTATPGPEDRPLNWRSDTAEFAKKAISYFMPNSGPWNQAGYGNPTRSRQVHQFIANLKKQQVRQLGKMSAAKRDLSLAEFKLAAKILEEEDDWNCNRWVQAMRMQFHMIGRGDDVHHMETKSLHVHPKFDFALQTKMMWSKNVLEERDCPPQIMLGSANPAFCIILSLAIYLEERFSRFGMNSKYLYTEDVEHEAPKRAVVSYSKTVREKVFLNRQFQLLSSNTRGSLGMHSFRKLPATWAILLGATQDEVDIRGRWKRGRAGRVSSRYINPCQPYSDAKVCGLLCVDGPIKYALKNGCGVSTLFLHEHVCPKISEYFGDEEEGSAVVAVLGTALLWACFDPQVQDRVPQYIQDRVKTEYDAIRPEAFGDGNPVEKLRLVIFRAGENLLIDELPPLDNNEDGGGRNGRVNEDEDDDDTAGQGGGGGASNERAAARQRQYLDHQAGGQGAALHHGAGRQEYFNHLTAQLHGVVMRLTRLEEQMSSTAGELKMDLQRQLASVNKNIQRLQLMAPTTTRRVNNNAGAAGGAAAPQQGRPNVQLSKRPKDLYSLWTEYTHGLGGLKAAKEFTPVERGVVKQKYYRRKAFWDVVATHVDAGYTAPVAVDLVYQVYGRSLSVTMVINKMLEDRKRYNGRPHPRLRIRTPVQPRLQVAPPPAAPRPAGRRVQEAYRNLPGRIVDGDALARHRRKRADRLAAAAPAPPQQEEQQVQEFGFV